jgi:hypothetical protein
MTLDSSRLARAMRLLRIGDDATAQSLADVLWLASNLPEGRPSRRSEHQEDSHGKADDDSEETSDRDHGKDAGSTGSATDAARLTQQQGSAPAPASLYPARRAAENERFVPATFVTVPAGDALPNRLLLERALKPFLKRYPSRRLRRLDPDATADATAERRGAVSPVFHALPERWFDVLLFAERGDAMEVWADTMRELESLLARHGAFRQVRILRYGVGPAGVTLSTIAGQPLSPRVASAPEGRRLCLFLTNGTSPEWNRKPLIDFVRALGKRTVVAIVQMLPPRAWGHTVLGDAMERLHSLVSGAPNGALLREDPFTGAVKKVDDSSRIPVFTLQHESTATWSRFVMNPRKIVSLALKPEPSKDVLSLARPATLESRLATFRSIASRPAFQLLRLIAAVPMTLPIMRLVQRGMPEPREQSHLAEVLLSGLIERVTPLEPPRPPEEVFFDFISGARELLIGTLSSHETDAMDAALRPAQERLREYVERQTGIRVKDFRALLEDPSGLERLPADARAFLEVSRRIYELRGLAPIAAAPENTAIVLKPEGPVAAAILTPDGEIVYANYSSVDYEYVRWWRLGARNEAGGSNLFAGRVLLAAAALSPRVIAVEDQWLSEASDAASPRQFLPARVERCALSADGRFALLAEAKSLRIWDLAERTTVDVRQWSGGSVTAVAMASSWLNFVVADKTSISTFRDSAVSFFNIPGATAVAISDDGRRALSNSAEPFALLMNPDSAAIKLPVSEPSCVAMTPDGRIGAVGGRSGAVTLWDLDRLVHLWQYSAATPIVAISLSADGTRLLYSTAEEIRILEVGHLTAQAQLAAPPEPLKARFPRRVHVAPYTGAEAFAERVRAELAQAGHELADSLDQIEYQVFAGSGPANPYFPDALYIASLDDLPRLLSELDQDPPGQLSGMPALIVSDVDRPELEERLALFFTQDLRDAKKGNIRPAGNSRASELVAKVLQRIDVRRAFPGGIYWNGIPSERGRKGARLVIAENLKFRPSTVSPVNRVVIVRMIPSTWDSKGVPFIDIPLPSNEDADRHLRIQGQQARLLSKSYREFHRNIPRLITLLAGLLRRGWRMQGEPARSVSAQFEPLARTAVGMLAENERSGLFRLAAFFKTPPLELVPDPSSPGLALARDCGWLRYNNTLISTARTMIVRRYATGVAKEHEAICAHYENLAAQGKELTSHEYWPLYLIPHAHAAGGVKRVEQLLRNRYLLYSWLQRDRDLLTVQLEGLADRTPLLESMRRMLISDPSWRKASLSRVAALIAPQRNWPESSGVPHALASGIDGRGIRVLVIGTGCNSSHPEFAPVQFSAPAQDPDGYGTQLCSILAGTHIGVAPGVILEPTDMLKGSSEGISETELWALLVSLLERPRKELPDIVCLTLSHDYRYAGAPAGRDVIRKLSDRGVLVIAAAGNGGPKTLYVPAVYPEVLSVGACDVAGKPAEFSSTGSAIFDGRTRLVPDLFGYGIAVPVAIGSDNYGQRDGTAMACAYVCGIAALYAQALGLRGSELRELLIRTAEPATRLARFTLTTVS